MTRRKRSSSRCRMAVSEAAIRSSGQAGTLGLDLCKGGHAGVRLDQGLCPETAAIGLRQPIYITSWRYVTTGGAENGTRPSATPRARCGRKKPLRRRVALRETRPAARITGIQPGCSSSTRRLIPCRGSPRRSSSRSCIPSRCTSRSHSSRSTGRNHSPPSTAVPSPPARPRSGLALRSREKTS